jgi:TonB family protein
LKGKYPGRGEIAISVFDSQKAAQNAAPMAEWNTKLAKYNSHQHASYYYNRNKKDEEVVLYLIAGQNKLRQTIFLPVQVIPECRFAVAKRCVMMINPLDYPRKARKEEISGSVHVKGKITANGRVDDVSVVEGTSASESPNKMLVEAAKTNLKSWRFEPRPEELSIDITYTYKLIASPFLEHGIETQVSLPDSVLVTANPLH